jgi:hypothetical protein
MGTRPSQIRQCSGKQAIAEPQCAASARISQPRDGLAERRAIGTIPTSTMSIPAVMSSSAGARTKILSNRTRIDPGPAESLPLKTLGKRVLRRWLVEAS